MPCILNRVSQVILRNIYSNITVQYFLVGFDVSGVCDVSDVICNVVEAFIVSNKALADKASPVVSKGYPSGL